MHLPAWLSVRPPMRTLDIDNPDLGEQEAISLALELHADLLLIHEADGRQAALEHGLQIVGVLEAPAARDLVNLPDVLCAVQRTDFRLSPDLIAAALECYRINRCGVKGAHSRIDINIIAEVRYCISEFPC